MRLSLTGRHVEVTPSLRQLVNRRLVRVERILNDNLISASVVVTLEKRLHTVEITIHARGDNMLTGKGSGAGWPQAFAPAMVALLQQVSKVKEKWVERKRRGASTKALVNGERPTRTSKQQEAAADMTADLAVDMAELSTLRAPRLRIAPKPPPQVRRQRYAVKPMSLEDAASRIDATREPFVVFRQIETERIAILYQRPDGRLGLIDPEI
jgi:putative sigma-54 modulation protein